MKLAEVEKRIGKNKMKEFAEYMTGQTVSMEDGEINYYECDVGLFVNYRCKGKKIPSIYFD